MSKKNWACMALVLAALVCCMTLVGCDGEYTPNGKINVYNRSESTSYWVKTSDNTDWVEIASPDGMANFWGMNEEAYYTVYYCQKYEDERDSNALDDRVWYSKSCYVTIDETTDVYIP